MFILCNGGRMEGWRYLIVAVFASTDKKEL